MDVAGRSLGAEDALVHLAGGRHDRVLDQAARWLTAAGNRTVRAARRGDEVNPVNAARSRPRSARGVGSLPTCSAAMTALGGRLRESPIEDWEVIEPAFQPGPRGTRPCEKREVHRDQSQCRARRRRRARGCPARAQGGCRASPIPAGGRARAMVGSLDRGAAAGQGDQGKARAIRLVIIVEGVIPPGTVLFLEREQDRRQSCMVCPGAFGFSSSAARRSIAVVIMWPPGTTIRGDGALASDEAANAVVEAFEHVSRTVSVMLVSPPAEGVLQARSGPGCPRGD